MNKQPWNHVKLDINLDYMPHMDKLRMTNFYHKVLIYGELQSFNLNLVNFYVTDSPYYDQQPILKGKKRVYREDESYFEQDLTTEERFSFFVRLLCYYEITEEEAKFLNKWFTTKDGASIEGRTDISPTAIIEAIANCFMDMCGRDVYSSDEHTSLAMRRAALELLDKNSYDYAIAILKENIDKEIIEKEMERRRKLEEARRKR